MKESLNLILGGATVNTMLTYCTIAYIGLIVNIFLNIIQRKPDSPDSPYDFSWAYWFADSWRRILTSIILIPFVVIFGKFITGSEMNIYLAFLCGFSSDYLAIILKRQGMIKGCKV